MGDRRRLAADCIRWAWKGSVSVANAWGPIVGAVALAGLFRLTGMWMTIPTGWPGIAETAAMCVGAAWTLIFLGRLAVAPFEIALEQRRRAVPDEVQTRHTAAIEAQTEQLRQQNELHRRESDPLRIALRNRAQRLGAAGTKPGPTKPPGNKDGTP
jgi:hypothetical protein